MIDDEELWRAANPAIDHWLDLAAMRRHGAPWWRHAAQRWALAVLDWCEYRTGRVLCALFDRHGKSCRGRRDHLAPGGIVRGAQLVALDVGEVFLPLRQIRFEIPPITMPPIPPFKVPELRLPSGFTILCFACGHNHSQRSAGLGGRCAQGCSCPWRSAL